MTEFEDIYTQYAPQVYRVCMGYVNDADQAKDLVQETFISVWKNLRAFEGRCKISTWIFRIATNNCLRAIEKNKRMPPAELPFDLPAPEEESPQERLTFLYSCIAALEETDRIIIGLVMEDLPQAEIASIVGINIGNLRVKIYRIKEKLAIKFKQHEQFE